MAAAASVAPVVQALPAVTASAGPVIIVALRRDATVEVSDQAKFTQDGTVARVIARLDAGIGDADGLCKITGTA